MNASGADGVLPRLRTLTLSSEETLHKDVPLSVLIDGR